MFLNAPTRPVGRGAARITLAALAILVASVAACSEDPTRPTSPLPSTATLVMPTTALAPGAVTSVVVRGGAFPAIPAPTLDGVSFAATRLDDTTMVFAMPSAPVGARTLAIALADGRVASGSLSAAAAVPIANPSAFITGALDAADALLDGLEASGVSAGELASARAQLATSRTQAAGLSAADLQALAQVLAANAAFFPQTLGSQLAAANAEDGCTPAAGQSAQADLEQCAEQIPLVSQAEAERVVTFYTYAASAIAIAAGSSGGVLTPIAVGIFGGLALAELRDGVAETLDRLQLPFPFAPELAEILGADPVEVQAGSPLARMMASSNAESVFRAGSPRSVRFVMRYTSPTASDAGRSPLIALMLSAYNAAAATWNSIRDLLPFFPEFPAFPASARESITKPAPARVVQLGTISPASITGTLVASGDTAVVLTFDSQTLSEDTPFTFQLVYQWSGMPVPLALPVAAVFRPVPVARVTLTPEQASLTVGDTLTFRAQAYDAEDNLLPGRVAAFSADQPQTLEINAQTGLSRALARGVTIVTARMGSAQSQATVDVEEGAVASIAIDQVAPSVNAGATLQLSATLRDAANNVLTSKVVTWTSATPAAATIGELTGLVTGVAQGSSVITATSEGKTAQVTVTVVQPAFSGWASFANASSSDALCAYSNEGGTYCWGGNQFGAGGNLTSNNYLLVPTRIAVTPAFASITQGGRHACGLTTDGAAHCWGDNTGGALGDGTQSARATAAPVAGGITFRTLRASLRRTCGISTSNTIYCWGDNPGGSFSGSGEPAFHTTPQAVPDQPAGVEFTDLAVQNRFACALSSTGALYCWGAFGSSYQRAPLLRSSGQVFVRIAGGGAVCGVEESGAAWCLGSNAYGQLGTGAIGAFGDFLSTPQRVAGPTLFSSVWPGGSRTCGISTAGVAFCWGDNFGGRLGIGSSGGEYSSPTQVAGNLTFSSIISGSFNSCGLTTDDRVFCWGLGSGTGTGEFTDRLTPVEVVNP